MHALFDTLFQGKKLVLFDIDGTLVNVINIHTEVVRRVVKEVTGITIENDKDIQRYFGTPEYQSFEHILRHQNYPVTHATIALLQEKRNELFPRLAKEQIPKNILPGIVELLDYLKTHHVTAYTYTGNARSVGESILYASGLKERFAHWIFSDDLYHHKKIQQRYEMILLGIEHYQQQTQHSIELDQVIIVGDTPRDITAAKMAKVDSIGVLTGVDSLQEMRETSPTYLVKNLMPNAQLL